VHLAEDVEDHLNFPSTWCSRKLYHTLEHLFRSIVVVQLVIELVVEYVHGGGHPGKLCRGFVIPIICFTLPAVYHASKDHGPD